MHLPKRRHISPWSNRVLLVALLLVVALLAPIWLDPVTLGELRGASPLPTAAPSLEPSGGRPRQTAEPSGAAPHPLARDPFTRSVAAGWGAANFGGRYEAGGTGSLSVAEGTGWVELGSDSDGSAVLADLDVHNVQLAVSVAAPDVALDDSVALGLELRVTDGLTYRPTVLFEDDEISVAINVIVDGQLTRIAGPVELDAELLAADRLRMRAQATGSDPTTVRMRVWDEIGSEPPTWDISIIDWTGRLQGRGSVGLAWTRIAPSGADVEVGFDDLAVQTTDAEESE